MDNLPQLPSAADLESRAARIADPAIPLKVKLEVASELREMIDSVRDSEASRVFPHMISVLLDILRNGEPSFRKDSTEYQFRRVLTEIIHRMPSNETMRPHSHGLMTTMLHLLRHDSEENGVTCVKTIIDIVRAYKTLADEHVMEFLSIFQELLANVRGLVNEYLSEDSPVMDANQMLPSSRSFKVMSEAPIAIVLFFQGYRQVVLPTIHTILPAVVDVILLESPAQKAARDAKEAEGGFWAGTAPTIKNIQIYSDCIAAQIKMMSLLAYLMKSQQEAFQQDGRGDAVAVSCIRLLQDCPTHQSSGRRELMVVLRHLMGTQNRRALVPHMEKLFSERVLLGPAVGSQETLRPVAYSAIADLVHHVRGELTSTQLARIVHVYSNLVHNPHLSINVQMLCAKMMFNMTDAILSKDTPEQAAAILNTMLQTCADKLKALVAIQEEVMARLERQNKTEEVIDTSFIEKERPVASALYATENPEDVLKEFRFLFRALLHGFRMCLGGLKKCDAPAPDGEIMLDLFEGSVRCMNFFDPREAREEKEAMDWLGGVLVELNPHVFQQVWTQKLVFFFEHAVKRPSLHHIMQLLFQQEATSSPLTAIVLRHLSDTLGELGEQNDTSALTTIRFFKMAFHAVGIFPEANESILAGHLGRLIMDSFPLAAKATYPTNYFHLMRALFRAIGSGAGRFELLYKEVLPLLPEMLDSLNRQLMAADSQTRDLLVELCLTVPLRLTHLLPHLHYLMQPLVLALQGSAELVSQGLRTLELCIDNLTGDFLDPILRPVLRDLMEALHSHLKPLPANHHHAHTTIRILGKLGGRNRRLLDENPYLQHNHYADPATALLSFTGRKTPVDIGPMALLAAQLMQKPSSPHRALAYDYLENTLTILINEGSRGRDRENVFIRGVEGLFDAIHIQEVEERAENYLRTLSHYIFTLEVRRSLAKDVPSRRFPSQLFGLYLDALPHALARTNSQQMPKAKAVVGSIIHELITIGQKNGLTAMDVLPTVHQIASRFTALCFDETWQRKSAGCAGIMIMARTPEIGEKWTSDRELDLVRTLLHVLKDLPHDPPRNVSEIVDILTYVIRVARSSQMVVDGPLQPTSKINFLMGMVFNDLSSPHPVVRQAIQSSIELISELSGRPIVELLSPHRDRILTAIYVKPLRALPTLIQIGAIEAIRYCVSLNPPLPELNDELLRLLHETLALADAEDATLINRANFRQSSLEVVQLRVACIKLLTASMPLADFYSKQHQTRQRVTSVYFKSLYSSSQEIKDVAYDGLRIVLGHQGRLPRDLLQTGLRPILMNLADPKRLSVPGLEGLARLLELLTNYFKVEIGVKLLDHFRIIADAQMLRASSRIPLVDNEGIMKLVRLVNIFHLLPSAANIFLEDLVNSVVQTEAQLHSATRSPFSEPLGKFLDRFPAESMDLFLRSMHMPRHLRTLRNILQPNLAPLLLREFSVRSWDIVVTCFSGADPNLVLPGLYLCDDLATLTPGWTVANPHVIDALLRIWRSEPDQRSDTAVASSEGALKHGVMISIFTKALEDQPRIDILFEIMTIYTTHIAMDLTGLTRFLYNHVSINSSILYRRNILTRFLTWFDDPTQHWSTKTYFLRYIVTPMILVQCRRPNQDGLLDRDILSRFHDRIWRRMNNSGAFSDADDMFKIELLHLTTVMVHHCPTYLLDAKKDIIKCAWHYITSDDTVVKQTAYLLVARFMEAYDTPKKFILSAWTGLLKPPHSEGRTLVRQALDILAPVIQLRMTNEPNPPSWARTTRRLLAEEGHGMSQIIIIYQLIIRQPSLFYPCRSLFVPHMVNSLSKLGLHGSSTHETRLLSLEALSVMFHWEQQESADDSAAASWVTPLGFRETMVSYLVRLATSGQDSQTRNTLVPRVLGLLKEVLGSPAWGDVSLKLDFFRKVLDQGEINEASLAQAVANARVLNVVCAEKPDSWYMQNAHVLQKLVQKGMLTEDVSLHDALHPMLDRLLHLFPLPKEDEETQSDMSEYHNFVNNAIGDGLRNMTSLRGTLLMLKSVVQVVPERIEPFSSSLMKLLSKLAKEHMNSSPQTNGYESVVRLLTSILEICQITVMFLADQRRWLLSTLVVLVEKSTSQSLCRFLLEMAREWALHKRDAYPTMKEKASWLQKMATFETRGDVFHEYLELIYDIYTSPLLRRSDLTSRLENAFLLGCRARDTNLRERFMDLLDNSIQRSVMSRLAYVLGVQSWEALGDHNWIYIALDLVLSSVDGEEPLMATTNISIAQTSPALAELVSSNRMRDLVRPMRRLLSFDQRTAHDTWVSVFSSLWARLSRKEQADVTHYLVTLLSREYHIRQCEVRPNVVQVLLDGINACLPPLSLPPHLIKYLAKTFGAWHVSLELLQSSLDHVRDDDATIRDSVFDSLAEVYAELAEEDMFYGLWRRRCLHLETNVAISYEQNGMWHEAQITYENAQNRARNGVIALTESEYCLWEDHWILAAEKLQHWDVLYDLARNDGNQELMLESAWRNKDWSEKETRESLEDQIQLLPEVATPRRRVFEAYIALVKLPGAVEKNVEFTRILEDAMQLSLRKWTGLPSCMSSAHIPLLQHFQQFVELQEAVQIFGSLSTTTPQNLEKKSSDLKLVLQAWRERLPNLHDDISVWSDLVAWRQNVFNAINKHYIPLIQVNGQNSAATTNQNTFGYRGYHETAWIINRFAHVARKHDLLDVAQASLKKIYELPNIEISEAFLKLREEARCHHQVTEELQAGLDLINNTNLMYFSNLQKAEFYTLKGMFYSKLGRNEESNNAFVQAVQLDLGLARAWTEWGRYSDKMFKENPMDLSQAANAVSCYLQAAGVYKNGKSRPLLTRVLWLLSVDDISHTISRAFDTYKGDAAFWYWITLIPQLCLSLSHREAKQARYLLFNLAKLHPQALFFPLRTTREDLIFLKRQEAEVQSRAAQMNQGPTGTQQSGAGQQRSEGGPNSAPVNTDATVKEEDHPQPVTTQGQPSNETGNAGSQGLPDGAGSFHSAKVASDNVDEIVSILKTAYPLLTLTLETMVDQFTNRFRATAEEEIYRFTFMLLQDGIQTYSTRVNQVNDDGNLSSITIRNIQRMAVQLASQARKDFDDDFINSKPVLHEYIRRLQGWRDRYEKFLDARPRVQPLDLISHWLTEFQYSKIDEIEVPGQYMEHVDNSSQFSRIQRFGSKFELCRGQGYCFKRFVVHGHDSTKHTFAVHLPAARWCRREERVMQLFRTFNSALTRRKESRKRNLHFHLPASISLSPNLRLVANDSSYITLQDVYDHHCDEKGISREDPVLKAGEKVKAVLRDGPTMPNKIEYLNLKKSVMDEVTGRLISDDVLSRYMARTMDGPAELWRMRKHFTVQLASVSFMTYVLCITSRHPARFHISRMTGQIHMSELLPGVNSQAPVFASSESVPFRFTPNLQQFVGPIGTEGLLVSGIVSIARALTTPEFDLDQQLCLLARDEVITWMNQKQHSLKNLNDLNFRNNVSLNIDGVVKKAELMACKHERTQDPKDADKPVQVMQTVTNLVSMATNPIKLTMMSDLYCPWF
ncbi:hypothetical protein BD410DRAFT_736870 [Rickenella mellea]|uniref:Atypical/PIKK/TRRAP protein kinase n=1 Tax=Rickenella mellea TaxID=50990 RepID=A0A4R5XHJ2_9AGAM|nr:hypothetical protein BD410DRAFT_736870 [Rickenella mellea]